MHDALADVLQVQQRAHGFADLPDGFLIVVFQAVKDAVDKFLNPVANGIEQKHHRQDENERKRGRFGEFVAAEGQVGYQNKNSINPGDCSGGQHIAVGAFDDGVDIEQVVFDNGIPDEYGEDNEKRQVVIKCRNKINPKDAVDDKIDQRNRRGDPEA